MTGKFNAAFVAAIFLCVGTASAWMGSGSGNDFSRDAANTFYCANVAGTPISTYGGLSASSPTLVLANPANSTKKLILLDVGINVTAAPAAAAGFMLAYSTGPVSSIVFYASNTVVIPALIPAVVNSTMTQVALSQGQCYGGAGTVLPNTPVAFRYLGGTTGAAAIGGVVLTDQTNGKVVIPPGSMISIQSKTVSLISAHFVWREE